MILSTTSPTAAQRFTPKWHVGKDAAPVFLLRAGTVMERELMEAELAGEYQAGTVWPRDWQEEILAGFQALGGDDAEYLVTLAEGHFAGTIEDPKQQAEYDDAIAILAQHWPGYRRLVAQQERREAIIRLIAFSRFCCGWENVRDVHDAPVPFERTPDGRVAEKALARLQRFDMQAAGAEAYRLQYPELSAEKNSASPSSSAADPEISTTDDGSRADGTSPASDESSKTPD